jgi:hypothetical protein
MMFCELCNIKAQNMELNEILSYVLTAAGSGSLSWLFTLKFSRKEAEANAMEQVQKIYQSLISDLQADRDTLKTRLSEMDERLASMEQQVQKNERIISYAVPLLCAKTCCTERKKIDISEL